MQDNFKRFLGRLGLIHHKNPELTIGEILATLLKNNFNQKCIISSLNHVTDEHILDLLTTMYKEMPNIRQDVS